MKQIDKRFHQKAAENMVSNQLVPVGVSDERILKAFRSLPRYLFIEEVWEPVSYIDDELPINDRRKIMRPEFAARMLQFLDCKGDEKALVIGAGSGYTACVLARLCNSVLAFDDDNESLTKGEDIIKQLGIKNVTFTDSFTKVKTFDAIFVEGSLLDTPKQFLDLLSDGGRLVVIEGKENVGKAIRYSNYGGEIMREEVFDAYATPLRCEYE